MHRIFKNTIMLAKLLIVFVALLCLSMKSVAQRNPPIVDQKSHKSKCDSLQKRYDKILAHKLCNGIVELGYSRSMVFHAKGKPYLIEEPYGEMMDFEIFYYVDMVVIIEYGLVNYIRIPEGAATTSKERVF